jgi:hypothetical protein
VIPYKGFEFPVPLAVQVMPSGEVRMPPLSIPAANSVPDQLMQVSALVIPEFRDVQVTLSGEVRTVPPLPTATDSVPDDAMPKNELKLMASVPVPRRNVHVTASGEVRIRVSLPEKPPPTATNCVPDQVMAHSGPPIAPELLDVQVIPSGEVIIVAFPPI